MTRKPHQSPYLFPNVFFTVSVNTWAHVVFELSLITEQCFLEQVVHCKALSDTEHEFLIVCACHRPSGFQICLGIDRIPGGRTTTKQVLSTSHGPSSPSSTSASCDKSSRAPLPCLANDQVTVSHDGTPAPILALQGDSVILSMVDFTSSPNPYEKRPRPSLLHLSILLPIIFKQFPQYVLLSYQCYFFARATYLVLIDHFDGVKKEISGERRASTWRSLHVSLWSAIPGALCSVALGGVALSDLTPLTAGPALLVPCGCLMAHKGWKLYRAITLQRAPEISDNEIRKHNLLREFRARLAFIRKSHLWMSL